MQPQRCASAVGGNHAAAGGSGFKKSKLVVVVTIMQAGSGVRLKIGCSIWEMAHTSVDFPLPARLTDHLRGWIPAKCLHQTKTNCSSSNRSHAWSCRPQTHTCTFCYALPLPVRPDAALSSPIHACQELRESLQISTESTVPRVMLFIRL